ncbi:MAG TPA: hypothetical protein DCQ31_10370 [Bacteroidales bacterium]|nr:hypothetical protein [Bacteroidales bacterium]
MKNTSLPISFVLNGIKNEQFAIFEENYTTDNPSEIKLGFEFKIDQTNRLVGVFIHCEYIQADKLLLKLIYSYQFKITPESWSNLQTEKMKIVLTKSFLAHLAMIATGTTRGIIFAKTEGTKLSNIMVPLINVSEMIQADAIFDL